MLLYIIYQYLFAYASSRREAFDKHRVLYCDTWGADCGADTHCGLGGGFGKRLPDYLM
jgi:hypothetical protein